MKGEHDVTDRSRSSEPLVNPMGSQMNCPYGPPTPTEARDTIGNMGGHAMRCVLTTMACGVAAAALVGCSSPAKPASAPPPTYARSDLVACAAVDADFTLIKDHKTVPAAIAQRVVTSGEGAHSNDLRTEARTLEADVTDANQSGVEQELSDLGSTCDALGVGPAKY